MGQEGTPERRALPPHVRSFRPVRASTAVVGRRAVLLVWAVLVVAAYLAAWRAPAVGFFHDDGLYAVTAKALAEGQGYQISSLPTPIPQTKYPVLFPALLSIVWRAYPAFPANLPWLKLVPLASVLLWLQSALALACRRAGSSAKRAASVPTRR